LPVCIHLPRNDHAHVLLPPHTRAVSMVPPVSLMARLRCELARKTCLCLPTTTCLPTCLALNGHSREHLSRVTPPAFHHHANLLHLSLPARLSPTSPASTSTTCGVYFLLFAHQMRTAVPLPPCACRAAERRSLAARFACRMRSTRLPRAAQNMPTGDAVLYRTGMISRVFPLDLEQNCA